MGAARWIRFAVLVAFAGLFLWLFYVRYWRSPAAAGDSLIGAGAFWIVPALIFALLALVTLQRR